MRRPLWNLVVDVSAAALFLGMLGTGWILRFPLPPGAHAGFTLWGLSRIQWGDIHFWVSVGFVGILLTHLAMHWTWLVSVIGRRMGWTNTGTRTRWRSALFTLAIASGVVLSFAWITQVSVRESLDRVSLYPEETVAPRPETSGMQKLTVQVKPHVDFWKEVNPIFTASCLSCHGPQRARADFRVDRREDFLGKDGKEKFVLPGKSAESSLVAIVSGLRPNMAMAKSHKLPEHDIAVLKAWIDGGALWPEASVGK